MDEGGGWLGRSGQPEGSSRSFSGPGALNQNSSAVSRRSEKGKKNRRGLSLSMQAHDLLRLRVLPGLKWWILALRDALASLCAGRAASEQVWAAAGKLGRKGSLPARVSGSEYVFASLLIMPSWQIGISSLEKKYPTVRWENCCSKSNFFLHSPVLMIQQMQHIFFSLKTLYIKTCLFQLTFLTKEPAHCSSSIMPP